MNFLRDRFYGEKAGFIAFLVVLAILLIITNLLDVFNILAIPQWQKVVFYSALGVIIGYSVPILHRKAQKDYRNTYHPHAPNEDDKDSPQ